jgi:Rod binding domain-containing protein
MPGDDKSLVIGRVANPTSTEQVRTTKKPGAFAGLARPMPTIDKDAQATKAATDFEALLLQQMLDAMWKNVPSEGVISGSHDEQTYRQMYNEALAKDIAEHQSIGVKDAILKDFKGLHKKYNPSGS